MADTASADQFGAAADEYLAGAYDGDRRGTLLDGGGWDPGFAAELAGLGWYALAVPERHGGLGAPLSELGPVFVQLGRHLVGGPMLENVLLPALLSPARGEQAPAVAAAVETGVPPVLVDPCISDDRAASLGSVTLREMRLSGSVEIVRFARQAGLLVVVASTGAGAAVCLVDPRAPGVLIEDLASADPTTTFARVVLDGVHVDGPAIAGDDGLASRIRSWARLLIACELSGLAQRSVQLTVEHIVRREQFGRPIGSFQAVKHIAADMYAQSTGLHNLCSATLADADQASAAELDLLAATAKAHAADVAVRVCEDAIQLHGGMGFTTESDVSSYYKRALALRGWYGDATELRLRIGASVLGRDRARTDHDPARWM